MARQVCILILSFLLCGTHLMATGAGSRGSYTRGGWVGARYAAMGKTAEVLVDDVYSIYWNPAGLSELRQRQRLSGDDIKDMANKGDVDEISERDLIMFSDHDEEKFFLQLGITGSMLDIQRNTGFIGVALNAFRGVLGIGGYTIFSPNIDRRDYSGYKTGELDYFGSAAYIAYGFPIGISSIGVTGKFLYERIGNTNYIGGAADVGFQIYVLPFLKVGFVAQDLGIGLYPIDKRDDIKKDYDFGFPTLRLGIALITNRGFTLAVSGIKKLEQKTFDYGIGAEYNVAKWFSIYLGLNNLSFSTGLTLRIFKYSVSYAFTIDNVDYGYNHVLSMSMLF